MPTTTALQSWLEDHARPADDLTPLGTMVGDATVVALGAATRDAHELSDFADRTMRFLVSELGFRAFALEGDDSAGILLDNHVRTGAGDLRAILANARSFWQTEELHTALAWLRRFNATHRADPVHVVHSTDPARHVGVHTGGLDTIDRMLAENALRWHADTGQRIVYWGGTAHTAVAPSRILSPAPGAAGPSAGSHLRDHLGAGYLSIGLTFDHGRTNYSFTPPPPDFAEAPLAAVDHEAFLLDLREHAPAELDQPSRTRLIGPVYDAAKPADFHLAGDALTRWFDVLAHHQQVTPVS